MHVPPWRKAEYIKAKWLSPHARGATSACDESNSKTEKSRSLDRSDSEFELMSRGDKSSEDDTELGEGESVFVLSESYEEEKKVKVVKDWKPPEIKPKSLHIGARIVTGLALIIEEHQP